MPGPSVFPLRLPGVSGDFWGSQEGCQGWRRKWQPTPVLLPGESQGRGAWWAAVYGVAPSRTRLKRLSSSRIMPYNVNVKLGKMEGRRRKGRQRMGWLDGITNSIDIGSRSNPLAFPAESFSSNLISKSSQSHVHHITHSR